MLMGVLFFTDGYLSVEQLPPPQPQELFLPSSVGLLLHEPPENFAFFLKRSRIDMPAMNRPITTIAITISFSATIGNCFIY